MAARKKATPDVVEKIMELKNIGYTQRQIGRMVGIHHATVGRVLRGEPTYVNASFEMDADAINRKVSSIPKELWDEWESVTAELRRHTRHDAER